ncbi:hydrolase [Limnobacter parvus]|uniref:Hydrolase n=1 Tax=Limnobacter parvus TaxID=2939690 RepID=A0ABT1XEY3_9BURK|nr:hydrolase [Limnobacter parvus]MCR2745841.1 hydrolase [Limnobacter parvus]
MVYRSPWWLPDGHSQTILAARWASKPSVHYHRVRWATPDGDFIDLDFTEPPEPAAKHHTLWVLFHGLEGCSRSHYSLAVMNRARMAGALGVVVHFRGCSGENNLMPRAYHSGDSAEMDWILRRLRETFSAVQNMHVTGVSLGGNVLLKWLGEQEDKACEIVSSAVSVSAPVDLQAGANSLARGFNLVYTRMFLSTLIPKSIEKIQRYPQLGRVDEIAACKDFFDFDNRVTAPWHGFRDAEHYYAVSSAKPLLKQIVVPTLMIHAKNDPFMNGQHLPTVNEVSPKVQCLFTQHGGHVGFANGWNVRLGLDWLPKQCDAFFAQHLGARIG